VSTLQVGAVVERVPGYRWQSTNHREEKLADGWRWKRWDVMLNGELVGGKVSHAKLVEVHNYRGYACWVNEVDWVALSPAGRAWAAGEKP
jgi:hypothetical protein